MNLQPTKLESDLLYVRPLLEADFDALFAVASDPAIWKQHPNKDRYKKDIFQEFFATGIASGGAFLIFDKLTNEVVGSSRYYDLDEKGKSVAIGYTFIATKYWGKGVNKDLKNMMINYAFQFMDKVIFHVGNTNIRSQLAVGKIGGIKIGEEARNFTSAPVLSNNFVYQILKSDW